MKKWKETMVIKDKNLVISLSIDIEDNNLYYSLSNDNTQVDIKSESHDITKAKKKFSDLVISLLKHWNDKDSLELMFDINGIHWDIDINNIDTVPDIEWKKELN